MRDLTIQGAHPGDLPAKDIEHRCCFHLHKGRDMATTAQRANRSLLPALHERHLRPEEDRAAAARRKPLADLRQ